jgi:hypothetical protein
MISSNGYPCETHDVVTEDGYILAMHRIPYSKKSPTNGKFVKPGSLIQ